MASKALWYVAKKRAELRDEAVAAPAAGELRVRARFGAVSRGTERLVFEGRVPESEFERMRAPFMGGAFPHPVKYGYSIVGTVEEGPRRGRTVFVLHPHQSEFVVPERPPRRCRTTCRRSARCSPPTWRRRSTRSGTARPGRPIASRLSAAVWSGFWSRACAPGCRAPA